MQLPALAPVRDFPLTVRRATAGWWAVPRCTREVVGGHIYQGGWVASIPREHYASRCPSLTYPGGLYAPRCPFLTYPGRL